MDGLDKAIHHIFDRLVLCQDDCHFSHSRDSLFCFIRTMDSKACFTIWQCAATSPGRDASLPANNEHGSSLVN